MKIQMRDYFKGNIKFTGKDLRITFNALLLCYNYRNENVISFSFQMSRCLYSTEQPLKNFQICHKYLNNLERQQV